MTIDRNITNHLGLVGDGRSDNSAFEGNQLKLLLSHLSERVNKLMPGSITQSLSRRFSEFVPKPTKLEVTTTIRSVKVTFPVPKGMRQFLYYEAQISDKPSFAQAQSQTSVEPTIVFAGLSDGTVYYVRVRVVTSRGEAGPWSDTLTAPRLPIGKIIVTDFYPPGDGSWDNLIPATYTSYPQLYTPQINLVTDYTTNGGVIFCRGQVHIEAVSDTTIYDPAGVFDRFFLYSVWLFHIGEGYNPLGHPADTTNIVQNFIDNSPYYTQFPLALKGIEDLAVGPDCNFASRIWPTISTYPLTIGFSFHGHSDNYSTPTYGARCSLKKFQIFEIVEAA